jgi:transcriptional regulator with XRE-family HTH domain
MQTLTLNDRTAANIRAELARRQMTHDEVAKRLGLARNAVTAMLNGQTNITLSRLEVIADLLELEPSKLLND